MTIGGWLSDATKELVAAGGDSARLDSELILSHTIRHPRTYLHAHPDEMLEPRQEEIANARLDLRKDRVPIAYIIGHKEFYGRRFFVTPATLVPRPESEQMITSLRQVLSNTESLPNMPTRRLADIGTGTGCLGITAKLEYPELDVSLLDISRAALKVAKRNATSLGAEVEIFESNLLDGYPYSPDIVLANLPYVDKSWKRSKETNHEPAEALFAEVNGTSLIEKCFSELSHRIKPGGLAIFEADPRQWPAIKKIAHAERFELIESTEFVAVFSKTSTY